MFWRKKVNVPIQTGTFRLSAELPNKRGIDCSIGVLQGETLEDINAKLDLAQEAIERQRYRCEIPELEAKREAMLKGVQQAREIMADLEERQRTGNQLSSQERLNLRNMKTNIQKALEEIDKGEAAIEEAKKKAGFG